MKKVICEIIAIILVVAIIMAVALHMGYIFMPARYNYGATWNMYLEEPEESIDIMFVGSSMAYCDIIPAVVYEQTGYTSYLVTAPYMMPSTTYYYLKEALKTQTPQLIMLESTSFFFSLNEADYYKVNIGYMPYTANRLGATFAAPKEEWLGLLFPLYNYHEKWEGYEPSAYFTPRPDKKTDITAGYTYLEKTEPQEKRWEREFMYTEAEYEENISYLKKIVELCREKDIPLELFIVPACEYVSPALTAELRKEAEGVRLTNFTDDFEAIGLNKDTHFYDKRHLNFEGALLYTEYLSSYIMQNYQFKGKAHSTELWAERTEYINAKRKAWQAQ